MIFLIKNKLYNILEFFFSYPVQNFIILSLIVSFFFNIEYFYLLIEYINRNNNDIKIKIFLFFYLFDFFFLFFKFFFIFNLGCLTSLLFINLNKIENLNIKLNEKQQKYLYNFFIFFIFFIFFCHFFFLCYINNIKIYIFFIIFILFFYKEIKNFITYKYNNINNNFLLYFNKNILKIFILFNLIIFIIFIIIIFFFINFYYTKIYYYFFFDLIIFNISCIISFYFLNLNNINENLMKIQKKYCYYLFNFFILFFIILFICFFFKFIFFNILNIFFSTTYKSIIFFYFYIYIYIFYFFLYLFLDKNKYNIDFIKNICIYIFFFCLFCILIFFIIVIIKYLLSVFIINVYAMEDDVINEIDKDEIKKSIKNNGLGVQTVDITNDRIYTGNCYLNTSAEHFLNNLEKECKISSVKKRVVLFNQVVPVQDFMCKKLHEGGSYMHGNMLHIDENISCYTHNIKKNFRKVFNSDENNV